MNNHVIGCHCSECKPAIGPAPDGDEDFVATFMVRITVRAPSWMKAREAAERIGVGMNLGAPTGVVRKTP